MCSEFLLKLLERIGPVDGFGSLVVISDVLVERGFKGGGTEEVIGLQAFALKHTEPDFDLIQPGGMGRHPEDLKVEWPLAVAFLLTEPPFKLFGRVRGAQKLGNRQSICVVGGAQRPGHRRRRVRQTGGVRRDDGSALRAAPACLDVLGEAGAHLHAPEWRFSHPD